MTILHMTNQKRGRPAGFAREQLIEKVAKLFWTHGYNNLSFNVIAQKTGLKRSSLYNSFKTKEALFTECLDYYDAKSPTQVLYRDDLEQNVGGVLRQMFDEICLQRSQDKNHRGCMAANIYDEMVTSDTELGEKLREKHRYRRERLIGLLQQAIHNGELSDNEDVYSLANIILSFMNGLNMHAKEGMSLKALQNMSHVFLAKLGFIIPS